MGPSIDCLPDRVYGRAYAAEESATHSRGINEVHRIIGGVGVSEGLWVVGVAGADVLLVQRPLVGVVVAGAAAGGGIVVGGGADSGALAGPGIGVAEVYGRTS